MTSFPPKSLSVYGACAAAIALLLFAVVATPNRNTISYHLQYLTVLKQGPFVPPHRVRDVFSRRTLQWLRLGRPTFQEWGDRLEEEQQALINLGYYERKWVPWKNGEQEWESAFTNTAIWRERFCIHGDFRRPTEIRLTARPAEILEFEAIVRMQLAKLREMRHQSRGSTEVTQ